MSDKPKKLTFRVSADNQHGSKLVRDFEGLEEAALFFGYVIALDNYKKIQLQVLLDGKFDHNAAMTTGLYDEIHTQ